MRSCLPQQTGTLSSSSSPVRPEASIVSSMEPLSHLRRNLRRLPSFPPALHQESPCLHLPISFITPWTENSLVQSPRRWTATVPPFLPSDPAFILPPSRPFFSC